MEKTQADIVFPIHVFLRDLKISLHYTLRYTMIIIFMTFKASFVM